MARGTSDQRGAAEIAVAPPDQLYRRQVPAWLLSLGLHTAVLVSIAVVVPKIPQGAAQEAVRTGGIVLVSSATGERQYLSEEDAGGELAGLSASHDRAPRDMTAGGASETRFPETPTELAGLLPSGDASIVGSDAVGPGADSATAMAAGGSPSRQPKFGEGHGYTTTGVFGVTGSGTKFVYVFDRSGSMDGFQGRPIAAAKQELLQSIESLGATHQFQIIFYNERPTLLNPRRDATPRLLFGNETDKKIAHDFVRGILADGGTQHLEPLKMALRMQPHVIFFLTDADEPMLSNAELAEIRRLNDRVGASINAIEFGAGPPQRSENFLVRLARENSGAHVYVDVTKLPRK
jgi:hypothetical protein